MMVSAQWLTATRICAAHNCAEDAEPNGSLCWRCARKPFVKIHEHPPIDTDPSLLCCTCRRFKPDAAFCHQHRKDVTDRRGRHQECRACSSERRRRARARMTPAERQAETDRARTRRQAQAAAEKALLGWPPL